MHGHDSNAPMHFTRWQGGLAPDVVARALQLPRWFAERLIWFGAVYFSPVPPPPPGEPHGGGRGSSDSSSATKKGGGGISGSSSMGAAKRRAVAADCAHTGSQGRPHPSPSSNGNGNGNGEAGGSSSSSMRSGTACGDGEEGGEEGAGAGVQGISEESIRSIREARAVALARWGNGVGGGGMCETASLCPSLRACWWY